MAIDSLLDLLKFLNVALKNLHVLLQLFVVLADLVNALLVFVRLAHSALLALLASAWDLRACLEMLLQILERESFVSLLLFARTALEGTSKLQWRLFFAGRLQMFDHSFVIPRLLLLFGGRLLLTLVLTSLALRRLLIFLALGAATCVELDS